MLLNEGLLKSSRPVKDPCSTGTHKTQQWLDGEAATKRGVGNKGNIDDKRKEE